MQQQNMDLRLFLLIGALTFGGSAGGSFVQNLVNPPRPDPFTASQANELNRNLTRHIDATVQQLKIELVQLELNIRRDMPPEETRKRIAALEDWVKKQDPDWSIPTSQWGPRYGRSR